MTATPWIGPNGQRMERLELHLTYVCPHRCVFCSEAHRMEAFERLPVSWGQVATLLRLHASRGITSLHVTGGEPTLHPRFLDILKLARKLGMRTSIGTNGSRLCRPEFAQDALALLDEVMFSLHGPDAATHDGVTGRSGSFERIVAAIENTRRLSPGLPIFVNTVFTARTLDRLPDTVDLAVRLGASMLLLSNPSPEGRALDDYEELAPRLSRLREVLPEVPERAGTAIVRFFAVPACILGRHRLLSNDFHWDPRVTVEWVHRGATAALESQYNWDPSRNRAHVASCRSCAYADVCPGVYARYAELWPTDEIGPIDAAGAPCPKP